MLKKSFISALILLLCFSSFGQDNVINQKKSPKIKFEVKTYNFGKIPEDKLATYKFRFFNNGNTPLIITNVTSSCKCTIAEWTKKPIMPGDTGIIPVSFNPKGYEGLTFRKTISVYTNVVENNNQNTVVALQIMGRVLKFE